MYAVGTGQIAAIRRLNRRRQYAAMSLARTLLHVHEAMLAARNSERKGVGRAKYYVVLKKREEQPLYLDANSSTLESWRKAYRGRKTTASLDDSTIAAKDIYMQLHYRPRVI